MGVTKNNERTQEYFSIPKSTSRSYVKEEEKGTELLNQQVLSQLPSEAK